MNGEITESPGTERLQEVLSLAQRSSTITAVDIWRSLSRAERLRAAHIVLLDEKDEDDLKHLRLWLLDEVKGFRPAVVLKWTAEECAKRLSLMNVRDAAMIERYVIAFHLTDRRAIQIRFLDAAGVKHKDGYLVDATTRPLVESRSVMHAVNTVLGECKNREDILYVAALAAVAPEAWPDIASHFRHVVGGASAPPSSPFSHALGVPVPHTVEIESAAASEAGDGSGAPGRESSVPKVAQDRSDLHESHPAPRARPAFRMLNRQTELDDLLIASIVDTAGEGSGAMLENALDRVLDEVVRLQPRRHPSYFHLGFRDALRTRPCAETIIAANEERWRWYLAGYVVGLARQQRDDLLLAAYDSDERIRTLGNGSPPTDYCVAVVAKVLAAANRHAEAAQFVAPRAIVSTRGLASELLAQATELLRVDRVAAARGYLDVLSDGLELWAFAESDEPPAELRLDVKRRLAHCLRHEGNVDAARALLEEVIADEEVSPDRKAMVLGDLGLIAANKKQLASVELPIDRADCIQVRKDLERGQGYFEAAAAEPAAEAAHGNYVLGMIRLLKFEYAGAFNLLESALAAFDRERQRYGRGGLLLRARFHVGLAGLASGEHTGRAQELWAWVKDGMAEGLRVPEAMIESCFMGVSFASAELAEEVAERLLADEGSVALDGMHAVTEGRARGLIGRALLARAVAGNGNRALKDYQRAFPLLRAAGCTEEALGALDAMQEHAQHGRGVAEFEQVLENVDVVAGLWDSDDVAGALSTVREANGKYVEAATILGDVFHRMLSGEGSERAMEAAGIVDRIESYGPSCAEIASELRGRMDAVDRKREPIASAPQMLRHVRILVVGGNETQQRYQQALCDYFSAEGRNVEPVFIITGWTSNWKPFVDEFDRKKNLADGLVVMRFIRTELGKTIRRRWEGGPQIGSWGHGFDSLRRVIEYVAATARRDA